MSNERPFRDKYDDNDIIPIKDSLESIIVSGYDPFFILFNDNSIHRSFETNNWYWDFGDYVYYGYSSYVFENRNKKLLDEYPCLRSGDQVEKYRDVKLLDMFELAGDKEIVSAISKNSIYYSLISNFILEQQLGIHHTGFMIPLNNQSGTYMSTRSWDLHYTGIWLRSGFSKVNGVPTTEFVTIDNGCLYGTDGCPKTNMIREVGTRENPAVSVDIRELRDSCMGGVGRSLCYSNDGNTMNNSVYHVYKGAGVYPVSMKTFLTWDRNNRGTNTEETMGRKIISTDAREIDESDETKLENVYAQDALVVVLPVCPCISGVEVTRDDFSIGITADDFSCASAGCFGDEYWDRVIGRLGTYTAPDGKLLTTGYGPFVHVTVSGDVQPRSTPVTAFDWNWDDWFVDQDCVGDFYSLGRVVGGWSTNWATMYDSDYVPIHDSIKTCHIYDGVRSFFGKHTYTIPGCYKISCRPHLDWGVIPETLWSIGVEKPDCEHYYDYGEKIMVREVKPKFAKNVDNIKTEIVKVDNNTVDVYMDVFERLIPGSYPIGRIDWDFHDGTKIASIYRYDYMLNNTEDIVKYQKYFDDSGDPNITSGEAMSNLRVHKDGSSVMVDYGCMDTNYFVGNGIDWPNTHESTSTMYKETCPETWKMYHRYTKHEVDDGTRMISVTAYAVDTMSPCSGAVTLDLFPVYPDPTDAEGVARVIDTRLYDDKTLIVFEGDKTKQLYSTVL